MPQRALLLFAPWLLVAACASAPAAPPESTREAAGAGDLVAAALAAGDYARAHGLVGDLWLEQELARARAEREAGRLRAAWEHVRVALEIAPRSTDALALRGALAAQLLVGCVAGARDLLARSNPRDAMVLLDEALELDPRDAQVLFLRGECALRMGTEDGNAFFFSDARRSFLAAARGGRVPEAWSGAGRAGYLQYFDDRDPRTLTAAIEDARRGALETPAESELAALLSTPPARAWAEAACAGYTEAKGAGAPPERCAELFEGARAALEAWIGLAPEDPQPWAQLANLFAWEGRDEEARDAALRGLALAPEAGSLHEALVRAGRQVGGSDAVLALYADFVRARPEVALARWHYGVERVEKAIERLSAKDYDAREDFELAASELRRCRELDERYRETSLGYEALCRSGVGWCLFHTGDLDGARRAFLSMEDLLPGGLTWQYGEKLPSGIKSLQFVIGAYGRVEEESERPDSLVQAASIGNYLHEYSPEDPDLANDAGFLNRDAGVALELRAEELLARAIGLSDGPDAGWAEAELAGFRAQAARLLARAREHMEKSYRAYVDAAALAPQDARVLNDTGLILAYYLQRDPDRARQYFRDAIAVGTAQLGQGAFEDDEARRNLIEAVGDAHQNIGVVQLTILGDAEAARPWFEKSLEYPPPLGERFQVVNDFLPACRKVAAGELATELVKKAYYWSDLEPEKVVLKLRAAREMRRILRP